MCTAGTDRLYGFTLLELLVVLVIASLAISLVGPAFQRILPGLIARRAQDVFRRHLARAVTNEHDVAGIAIPAEIGGAGQFDRAFLTAEIANAGIETPRRADFAAVNRGPCPQCLDELGDGVALFSQDEPKEILPHDPRMAVSPG